MYKSHTHYNKTGTNTTLRNTLSCWVDSSLDHGRHDNPLIVSGEVYPKLSPGTAVPAVGIRAGLTCRRFSVPPRPSMGPHPWLRLLP